MRNIEEYKNDAEGFIAWCEDFVVMLPKQQKDVIKELFKGNCLIESVPEDSCKPKLIDLT